MRFDEDISSRYRQSVDDAFAAIIDKGNDQHRRVMRALQDSEMLIQVKPVSKVKASGVTGLISPWTTRGKIDDGPMSIREALGEIFICIAEETIDTGGQRGCEGTLVHEGRHAYDFAQMIVSLSDADVNPLSVFDPTLYELELAAHITSGDYMLCVNHDEYIDEGLQLMILGRALDGKCFVSDEGIKLRLSDSYGLRHDSNQGRLASELLGLR